MKILSEIRKKWKPRRPASHKGDYGRVFILAGSRGLAGAAHLAGMGALRAGAGLVTVGVPEAVYTIVARREAEVMVQPFPSTRTGTLSMRAAKPVLKFLKTQDVLAMGPGLSQNRETQKLVRKIISESQCPPHPTPLPLRGRGQGEGVSHPPLVIDADGLNALKGHLEILKPCRGRAILTPHPGEFIRLFGGKLPDRDFDRKKRAEETAQRFQIYLVLKGHHTVVASPDGKVYMNATGNPGMATGGAGDVLTGVIAAFLGQKFSLWDAGRFGVYLHGLAGDLAAKRVGQVSLTAGDLLHFLPQTISKIIPV